MKLILINIFVFLSLNLYSQKLSVGFINNEGEGHIFLTESSISRITTDSNYIVLYLKEGETFPKEDFSDFSLFLFSFDCFCSEVVMILSPTMSFRPNIPIVYLDDISNSIIQNGKIAIAYGHLKKSESKKQKLLKVFEVFLQKDK